MQSVTCECSGSKCPECQGSCSHKATERLFRVDMDDESGLMFCDQCGADAVYSGLFASDDEIDQDYPDDISDGLPSDYESTEDRRNC